VATNQGAALEALADPTRRALFELLARGPRTVGALSADVPVSRPAVSQHLKVLRECGLVTVQSQGTRHIYSVDPQGVRAVRDYFDQFWTSALTAFADAVDRPKDPQEES
jgi:DNA-binding transcriptional ArsR family regulator